MGTRTISLALAMLMLTGTLITPALADDPESNEPVWEWPEPLPPQDDYVLGDSLLHIYGPISASSNISATWVTNISCTGMVAT